VNQRLAAHKSRKGLSTAESAAPAQPQVAASSRAAQAAARVAARYAQAPSYSQMQAAEARAALRTAEIATQAALDANVAAQAALAGFEAASANSFSYEPAAAQDRAPEPLRTQATWEPVAEPAAAPAQTEVQRPLQDSFQNSFRAPIRASESETPPTRHEQDFALRPPAATRASQPSEGFTSSAEDQWEQPAAPPGELWGSEAEAIEPVEPDLPIHANLIEFPRELVATRKIRPRLAEGAYADADAERQLSIFEVDPGTISTEPEAASSASAPAASAWSSPEWSSIELEAQPTVEESAPQDEPAALSVLRPAPVGYRLMAALVDGALITSAFLATVLVAMDRMQHLPAAKTAELGAASALLLIALLYQTLFLILAGATPGISYARISLCTFDGQVPTRAQLLYRLGALLLSVLPVGLGVAWILFDDDHLSWHDQLSRTYLRRG
jgi:uncharacterized RDD family membrane protein YckC